MRILIHGINYTPELTGIGKYTGEMADWLASQGHEVRVVTAPPYYPQWRILEGYANTWQTGPCHPAQTETEAGPGSLQVFRCPLWVSSSASGLKRLLHLASFAVASFPVLMRQVFWRPNLVWVVEPPLFCAPQALLVARLTGAKAWLHIQDFEVDAAFDLGILRAVWLKRWVFICEKLLMRGFDRVSTISAKMLERLAEKGVVQNKTVLFYNWVDLAGIYPLPSSELRSQLGFSPTQTIALYSGNMGEKQGLEIVLEAALKLRNHPTLQFVLCGEGAAKARLQEHYGELPNVLWIPLQPLDKLNDSLNMADIHLLPQRGDVADLVMPSKLLGMLASGRAVLTTAAPETQIAALVSQCGVVAPVDDADAFAEALSNLAANPAGRQALGRAGRLIAEQEFSKESVLGKFAAELIGVTHA